VVNVCAFLKDSRGFIPTIYNSLSVTCEKSASSLTLPNTADFLSVLWFSLVIIARAVKRRGARGILTLGPNSKEGPPKATNKTGRHTRLFK
jgi:hypothetical protein